MDFFVTNIVHGSFQVHLASLIIAVVVSIIILHFLFKYVFLFAAKRNRDLYLALRQIFRGIPVLIGLQWGVYFCAVSFDIPTILYYFLFDVLRSLAILTVTMFISHLASGYCKYRWGKSKQHVGSSSILLSIVTMFVYAMGLLVLLESFGVSITPMLTALGVGGMATALALQDTLANLFSGINTLLSKQVKIGDFVKLASGESGHIVDMNWRNTTIKTTTDNMIVVPNKNIASSVIVNYAQPYESCSMVIPIGISYDSDLQKVETVTLDVAQTVLKNTDGGVDGVKPLVRYKNFGSCSIDFDVILRVKTIMDQSLVRHYFIKAIYERYKKENIVVSVHET
ncbi:MAG: mechanosensitive ion channel family protein [Megasphaera sp.]|jgi:small-conductance mechanosensitive channel|nr:mechanosensitive ion channel family protein [Megasphaera sp.]